MPPLFPVHQPGAAGRVEEQTSRPTSNVVPLAQAPTLSSSRPSDALRRPVEGYPGLSVRDGALAGVLRYDCRVTVAQADGTTTRPRIALGNTPPLRLTDIILAYERVQELARAGIHPKVGSMRFRDVVADFLQSRCDLRSVRTDGYRMPYLVELLGDMPLAKILEQHLERAIETLMATPVARGKSTRKRKPGTKRAYKALIRAFFGWTTRTGRTTSNPSLHMKLPRVDDQRTRLISPDECAAIGRHLSSVSPKVRLLLLLLMALGVRVGEALGARWPDVDETNATLMLPRTKPGPPRQVPLPPEALAVIAELRKFRRNEWLFPAERGDGHMVNPNKAFLGLLAAAGIKESTWVHDLRRLVATEMSRQEGTSIDDVRQLLGHAHLRTTQRYLVGSPERVRAGLAATSGLIHARLGFDQAASPSATNDDSKEE